MNIDDIETNLNNFKSEPEKVIAELLKQTAINRALLETLLDINVSIIAILTNDENGEKFEKNVSEKFISSLLNVQADIASRIS